MIRRKVSRIDPIPGLVPGRVRADGTPSLVEITALVGKIQGTFETFKTANDERVKALEKGREDVVTNEKVDKINAAVGDLDKEFRTLSVKLEAATNASKEDKQDGDTPERREYRKALNAALRKGKMDPHQLEEMAVKASISTDSNPDGGYVVTPEMDKAITRVATKTLGMRQVCGIKTSGSQTLEALHNIAGTTTGWVGEKASRPQTLTPQFAKLSFPAMEQYAMPATTQQALDDAWFDLEGWLTEEVGIAFREQEGDAFINADGVNKPRGFLNYASATSTPSAPSAWGSVGFTGTGTSGDFAASPNGPDALIDLIYSVKPVYRGNGKFVMNDLSLAKTRKLKDSQGHYFWQPSLVAGEPSTLASYPVYPDDGMPDFGANTYPIAFGDWERFYWIVDRMGTRVLRDPFSTKPYVLFYTTRRVGGGIRDFAAVKKLKAI